ncbi:MAG: hypothetical protein LBV40_08005 [Methanomicrobiales archaeon]|nr:hypothetical protein [Methanomicrobiales archaeon]
MDSPIVSGFSTRVPNGPQKERQLSHIPSTEGAFATRVTSGTDKERQFDPSQAI